MEHPAGHAGKVLAAAHQIWQVEREQARRIRAGQTLRQQTDFAGYLARRAADPSYTFRQHLRHSGGAIEDQTKTSPGPRHGPLAPRPDTIQQETLASGQADRRPDTRWTTTGPGDFFE